MFLKSYVRKIIILFFVLWTSVIFAHTKTDVVNVLTWWGYLDKPWISQYLYQQCGASISFDEYYSNEEFLRRFRESDAKYDIVIFAEPLYGLVKNEVLNKGADISNVAYKYNNYIKIHYLKTHYPKNIVYFTHSVTGILWDTDIIKINKNDGVENIFNKSKSNLVVIMDDPLETRLITKKFTVNNFINMIKSSRVFITNNFFSPLENQNNLAFSYLWSGEAFSHLVKYKNKYQFSVNPEYSFFSSDMIASLNKTKQAACIARTFASKDFLDRLQTDTFYLSPYGDIKSFNDKEVRMFYQHMLINLPRIQWMRPLSKDEFYTDNQKWKYIKLYTHNQQHSGTFDQ